MVCEHFSSINRNLATKIAGSISSIFQGLCVVLLAVIFVRLIWLVLAPGGSVSTVTFSGPPPGLSRDALSADVSLLTRENAFGADTAVGQELTQAPETKLNFRLVGLRSVAGDGQGSATIITPDGLQKRFVVGGEVIPGVRVEEILPDRVVLSHNGALESLTLGPGKDRYSVVGSDQDAVGPAASVPGPVVQDSTVRSTVSRQFLSQISLSTVGLETGESGYRMAPRGDERVLLDAGFANGDIIINVNGQEVDAINPEEVYSEFQESEQLSLKVRRGEETLNFELAIS
jgi:general secretion pathway protein C